MLYQAVADMHKDDPLGCFLDDAQLRQRDWTVFRKPRGSLVWNLAGGYCTDGASGCAPVLQTNRATVGEASGSDAARRIMIRALARESPVITACPFHQRRPNVLSTKTWRASVNCSVFQWAGLPDWNRLERSR